VKRTSLGSAIATYAFLLGVGVPGAWAQESPGPQVMPSSPAAVPGDIQGYPDSLDGLRHFATHLLAALESGDGTHISAYESMLAIPDPAGWFARTFGAVEARRLVLAYSLIMEEDPQDAREAFDLAYRKGVTEAQAQLLPNGRNEIQLQMVAGGDAPDPGAMEGIFNAAIEPIQIYEVYGRAADGRYFDIGAFVYADGGFRYVNLLMFNALSTIPAAGQSSDMSCETLKWIYAPPRSPLTMSALPETQVQGETTLNLLVNQDGTVSDVQPVDGDPSTTDAAMDSVRRWLFYIDAHGASPRPVRIQVHLSFRRPAPSRQAN